MVLGTEILRRQAAAEFPDATFAGFGDRMRSAAPGIAATEPSVPAKKSKVDQIERLTALREKGALSEGQYDAAKVEVLGQSG